MASSSDPSSKNNVVTTLIFDVDDTLYDVSTGFTTYRNGAVVQQFMVDRLGFADLASAKKVRDEYFEQYHATAKALTVAEQEGAFPEAPPSDTPRFRVEDLAEYWATNLDFGLLGGPRQGLIDDLVALRTNNPNLKLVAFSNGPRAYVKRCLQALGLFDTVFGGDEGLFAVDDVLPHCKPEKEAFEVIFQRIGVTSPHECIMVEDSMKNIRRAKELGMKTILIAGKGNLHGASDEKTAAASAEAEATKPGDAPDKDDPAVDVAFEMVDELKSRLPGLWNVPAIFEP